MSFRRFFVVTTTISILLSLIKKKPAGKEELLPTVACSTTKKTYSVFSLLRWQIGACGHPLCFKFTDLKAYAFNCVVIVRQTWANAIQSF